MCARCFTESHLRWGNATAGQACGQGAFLPLIRGRCCASGAAGRGRHRGRVWSAVPHPRHGSLRRRVSSHGAVRVPPPAAGGAGTRGGLAAAGSARTRGHPVAVEGTAHRLAASHRRATTTHPLLRLRLCLHLLWHSLGLRLPPPLSGVRPCRLHLERCRQREDADNGVGGGARA